MSGTLILFFHPEQEKSKANRAMVDAAGALDGVTVVNMAALYPTLDDLDVEAEVQRLYAADRLVLQFPIHWYCAPPLALAWQNTVLTRMFYVNPEEEGERLRGLPFMVAATAGNVPEAYTADGVNRFPLADLLHPFAATASRCGFDHKQPFLTYRANKLDEAGLRALGERYAAHLSAWTDTIPHRSTS